MKTEKLPKDFEYLQEMYDDEYYPKALVDKVKNTIKKAVTFIEKGNKSVEEIQGAFDEMVIKINDLQEEFEEKDSEIETVARESIAATVEKIIQHFDIDIEIEKALRERDW